MKKVIECVPNFSEGRDLEVRDDERDLRLADHLHGILGIVTAENIDALGVQVFGRPIEEVVILVDQQDRLDEWVGLHGLRSEYDQVGKTQTAPKRRWRRE